jgi:hypothetical protein
LVSDEMPDGTRIRYLDETDGCYKYINCTNDLSNYIKKLEQHFIDMGYIGRTRIVADEPSDIDPFRKRLEFLKEVAPSFKYKAAINHIEFIEEFKHDIDDFVPKLDFVLSNRNLFNTLKSELKGKLYWYVCCEPHFPNTYISSHLTESYLLGILAYYFNMGGLLRWNYTVWPENPRERISFRTPWWAAGDTNFVYPAASGKPLLSLRYKALQRGIQIYEMIAMLIEVNHNDTEILQEVFNIIFKHEEKFSSNIKSGKNFKDNVSIKYEDYQKVISILAKGISSGCK